MLGHSCQWLEPNWWGWPNVPLRLLRVFELREGIVRAGGQSLCPKLKAYPVLIDYDLIMAN
ncbi:hypothetical protein GBA52_023670 [Prunus armeniaca]|nr:hypothetical protein GBA52_023670 [Prunus armeniaca]